jgi:membrane associated rhomboid family serine protease
MIEYIFTSYISLIILVATIVMSLLAFFSRDEFLRSMMFHPYDVFRGRRLYTVLTSGFVHANTAHLAFNMFTFFFFGFALERILGHWQFLLLYMVSLVFCEIQTFIQHRDNTDYYSLGASGAVSAVLFSYILFNPLNRIYIMFIPIGIPAVIYAGIFIVISIAGSRRSFGNINHAAHLWGAVSGVLLTILLKPDAVSIFLNAFGF